MIETGVLPRPAGQCYPSTPTPGWSPDLFVPAEHEGSDVLIDALRDGRLWKVPALADHTGLKVGRVSNILKWMARAGLATRSYSGHWCLCDPFIRIVAESEEKRENVNASEPQPEETLVTDDDKASPPSRSAAISASAPTVLEQDNPDGGMETPAVDAQSNEAARASIPAEMEQDQEEGNNLAGEEGMLVGAAAIESEPSMINPELDSTEAEGGESSGDEIASAEPDTVEGNSANNQEAMSADASEMGQPEEDLGEPDQIAQSSDIGLAGSREVTAEENEEEAEAGGSQRVGQDALDGLSDIERRIAVLLEMNFGAWRAEDIASLMDASGEEVRSALFKLRDRSLARYSMSGRFWCHPQSEESLMETPAVLSGEGLLAWMALDNRHGKTAFDVGKTLDRSTSDAGRILRSLQRDGFASQGSDETWMRMIRRGMQSQRILNNA